MVAAAVLSALFGGFKRTIWYFEMHGLNCSYIELFNYCFIVADLFGDVQNCVSSPHPEPFRLQQVFNVDAWLKPHLTTLHEHTHPHCFKFACEGETMKAVMYYRKWSSDDWMGPVQVLKVCKITYINLL